MSRFVARPLGHVGTSAVRWGMSGLADRRPSDALEADTVAEAEAS